MKHLIATVFALGLTATALQAKPLLEMFPDIELRMNDEAIQLMSSLDFKQGDIVLGDRVGLLTLTDDYYFLDAEDARYVLSELWGNPPDVETLGMVFPAGQTPLDDIWGIDITYEEIGYVSDDDANGYDYNALLDVMREDLETENEWRLQNNYERIDLVGWAAEPHYDATERKLYWAKELAFAGSDTNTLNYNIRALGRRGVLVLNFIAGMHQLDDVNTALPDVLAMTDFAEGNRYADFDPSIDTVAAVGIGGLIAGKVLAKSGFLLVALLFLKKFWFLALLPLLWLKKFIFKPRGE